VGVGVGWGVASDGGTEVDDGERARSRCRGRDGETKVAGMMAQFWQIRTGMGGANDSGRGQSGICTMQPMMQSASKVEQMTVRIVWGARK
jgi:hypothetical protein